MNYRPVNAATTKTMYAMLHIDSALAAVNPTKLFVA